MEEYIIEFKNWIIELGDEHGVNPLTLGILYLCSKVSFVSFLGITAKKLRAKQEILMPLVFASLSFCVPYVYFIIAGRNISIWVYLFIGAVFSFGAFGIWKKVTGKPKEGLDDIAV